MSKLKKLIFGSQNKKKKLVFLNIVNKTNWSYIVNAHSETKEFGWRRVEPDDAYSVYFSPSKWELTNRCLCAIVQSNGKIATFPLYNNGAPTENNLFEIRNDGIYMNGQLFSSFKILI
jgi:hypothetical protein